MVWLLLALSPALLLLIYYRYRDRHPEPWAWVTAVFVVGALACIPTYPLERWVQGFFPHPPESGYSLFLECLLIPGLIEESVKLLVVVAAIWGRSDFDDPVDALIYGTAGALGFTFGEDLRYYFANGTDFTRLFSTAAHPWFSCFWAASLGWARVLPRRQGLGLVALGLTASVLVHALFDFIILGAEVFPHWSWLRFLLTPLLVGLYLVMEKQLEALQEMRGKDEKEAGLV
jgi:RsiW-degrading membrane proteinase PrsW (M82 family)